MAKINILDLRKEELIDKICSYLKNKDFNYVLAFDVIEKYSCEEYGCYDDPYCRCGKIIDVKLLDDLWHIASGSFSMIESFLDDGKYTFNAEFIYILDRVFNFALRQKSFQVDYKKMPGYYGEELESVSIIGEFHSIVESALNLILSEDSETQKLDFYNSFKNLLAWEYSQEKNDEIFEENKFSQYSIEKVKVKQLVVGNSSYDDYLNQDLIKGYNSSYVYWHGYGKTKISPSKVKYPIPIGIYKAEKGDKFRVLDGFHRRKAAIEALDKDQKVPIIVLKKDED